jgi:hypothetical protein
MVKRTFHGDIKPDHIFFDNNCTLAKMVKDDPFFANIGLTVDVFHFKAKHYHSYHQRAKPKVKGIGTLEKEMGTCEAVVRMWEGTAREKDAVAFGSKLQVGSPHSLP